jgi:hypothetical protein
MTPDQLVRAAAALANARKGPAIAALPADGIPHGARLIRIRSRTR